MKNLMIVILATVLMLCLLIPAYSWTEYKNIRYMDMDGDLANEIIIESKHGAGTGHYIEDMRIFKDNYPELELIFSIRTLDEYSLEPQYRYAIVSDVEFTEQTPENKGIRDIIVKSKKIYYKDEENKVVDKIENLGTKIFKWNGMDFAEDNASYKVDLDNDSKKEIIVVQRLFETISEDSLPLQINSNITIFKPDGGKVDSFSMPDRMGEVEFVSLNNDGFKQIVAWSDGGMHYTNIAIYGYKDGKMYRVFENGSACGVETDFKTKKPTIRIGRANWGAKVKTEDGEEINWSYASEPLWQVYVWDGKDFIYNEKLSTSPKISEKEELQRFLDKAKSLMSGSNVDKKP